MRIRISLAVLAVLALIVYGWLHSGVRPSPSEPPVASVRVDDPASGAAHTPSQSGVVRASEPNTTTPVMPGDDWATRSDSAKAIERGMGYYRAKKWTEAILAFEEAVKFKDDDFEARFRLSAAYIARRGPDDLIKAREAAQVCVRIAPDRVEGPYNIACANALLGDSKAALAALAEARRVNKRFVDSQARKDKDLATLHGTPEFELVLQEKAASADEPR